jgi:hypothetical protein
VDESLRFFKQRVSSEQISIRFWMIKGVIPDTQARHIIVFQNNTYLKRKPVYRLLTNPLDHLTELTIQETHV